LDLGFDVWHQICLYQFRHETTSLLLVCKFLKVKLRASNSLWKDQKLFTSKQPKHRHQLWLDNELSKQNGDDDQPFRRLDLSNRFGEIPIKVLHELQFWLQYQSLILLEDKQTNDPLMQTKELELFANYENFEHEGMKWVTPILTSKFSQLEHVSLRSCNICMEHIEKLSNETISHKYVITNLQSFDLSWNMDLGNDVLELLLQLCEEKWINLQRFSLQGGKINDQGCLLLNKWIEKNAQVDSKVKLRFINISCCRSITHLGIQLLDAIFKLKCMRDSLWSNFQICVHNCVPNSQYCSFDQRLLFTSSSR